MYITKEIKMTFDEAFKIMDRYDSLVAANKNHEAICAMGGYTTEQFYGSAFRNRDKTTMALIEFKKNIARRMVEND